jgi:hypothetical protein
VAAIADLTDGPGNGSFYDYDEDNCLNDDRTYIPNDGTAKYFTRIGYTIGT